MKKLFYVLFLIILSCSDDQSIDSSTLLIDNSSSIKNIITAFDSTVKHSIANPKKSNNELGSFFIRESDKLGLQIVEIEYDDKQKSSITSDRFIYFNTKLETLIDKVDPLDYLNSLQNLKNSIILDESLSNLEKQNLSDKSEFLNQFFVYLQNFNQNNYAEKSFYSKGLVGDSWWSEWKSCILGTVGSMWGGSTAGCGAIGGLGAFIGNALSGAPGAVAGGLFGCAAGAVAGGMGGAAVGYATFCD